MEEKAGQIANTASNRLYARVAPIYAMWVRVGSLGAFPSLYRRSVAELRLSPGATVLDVCCGTGELFPYLHAALGPDGHIIGCDLSQQMLAKASARSKAAGWSNITLIESDARVLRLDATPAAAIFSLCLSAIPGRETVLDVVIGFMPPGAPVVVIDSLTLPGRPLANFYNRLKGRVIGADPDCRLRDALAERLDLVDEMHIRGGVYTLFVGRTRTP
ncbi:methyltransferase domain-containing protein [Sinorhizobium meliloti]|nr:methyltransferase domain-containing protein [Sinorhizobium meliloti]MDX0212034.1 methyltransferase domain-containing protein [Sinorhizobium meliloti]